MTTSGRSRQTSFVDGSSRVTLWPTPRVAVLAGKAKATKTHGWDLPAAILDSLEDSPQGTWHNRPPTSSPPDTHASHSATPGSEPERMTPGTSGRGFSDCLPASAPTVLRGFVSRMSEGTSAWGSTVCSLTWTTSATPQRRGLFQLRASARSTGGTGCGLSDAEPTVTLFQSPMPSDVTGGRTTKGSKRQGETGLKQQAIAAEAQRMWPTPAAANAANDLKLMCSGDGRTKPNKLGWAVAEDLLPTPRASESELRTYGRTPTQQGEGTGAHKHHGKYLQVEALRLEGQEGNVGRKLNPAFVSRLMGFPDSWLDLDTA